jgi:tripartite ATP-independent transporter DctP family solute receptor
MKVKIALKTAKMMVALMFVMVACGSVHAADHKLRIAVSHNPASSWVQAAEMFAKDVNEASEGRIAAKVYHSNKLGNTREVCEMVRNNTLEAAIPGAAQLSAYTKEISVTVLPYIFKEEDGPKGMFSILDGPVGDIIDAELEKSNLVNLGWYRNGYRSVTNNKRPITKVEDLKGLKLRVLPSSTVVAFFNEVGVNSMHIDWSELFMAMKKGVVEGQENPPFFVWLGKVYEMNKYYSFTQHMNEPGVVVMSKKYLEALPADLQEIVTASAKKAETWQRDKMNKDNAEKLEILKEKGMVINSIDEVEMAKFREIAVTKVYPTVVKDLLCGPRTQELIDMILDAQK